MEQTTTQERIDRPQEKPASPGRNRVLEYIANHPAVVLSGIIASVLGLLVTLYFAFWPIIQKRELTYSVQPVRTPLVEVNNPPDIAVFYKQERISGDLTAAQVMICNSGLEPIKHEDILSPIALSVPGARIIEHSFSRRPFDGSGFHLDTNLSSGQLMIDWKILEQGENPIIQIIYTGKRDLPIVLTGRVVGQQKPRLISWPTDRGNLISLLRRIGFDVLGVICSLLACSYYLSWVFGLLRRRLGGLRRRLSEKGVRP